MIVFLTSGLWHGANWTYIIWGGLNGLFQVIGAQTAKVRKNCKRKLGIRTESSSWKLVSGLITFLLIDFTWIIFRADSVEAAFTMISRLFASFNPWVLVDGTLYTIGLSAVDFWIAILASSVLLTVDILHRRGVHIRQWILCQNLYFRWMIYYAAIFTILIFGFYGPNYDAAQFIYFQF